jgi:hypothetical protein
MDRSLLEELRRRVEHGSLGVPGIVSREIALARNCKTETLNSRFGRETFYS